MQKVLQEKEGYFLCKLESNSVSLFLNLFMKYFITLLTTITVIIFACKTGNRSEGLIAKPGDIVEKLRVAFLSFL